MGVGGGWVEDASSRADRGDVSNRLVIGRRESARNCLPSYRDTSITVFTRGILIENFNDVGT
jgi:hypothetical protein